MKGLVIIIFLIFSFAARAQNQPAFAGILSMASHFVSYNFSNGYIDTLSSSPVPYQFPLLVSAIRPSSGVFYYISQGPAITSVDMLTGTPISTQPITCHYPAFEISGMHVMGNQSDLLVYVNDENVDSSFIGWLNPVNGNIQPVSGNLGACSGNLMTTTDNSGNFYYLGFDEIKKVSISTGQLIATYAAQSAGAPYYILQCMFNKSQGYFCMLVHYPVLDQTWFVKATGPDLSNHSRILEIPSTPISSSRLFLDEAGSKAYLKYNATFFSLDLNTADTIRRPFPSAIGNMLWSSFPLPVSVKESHKKNFTVFPNPVSNEARLVFPEPDAEYRIISLKGVELARARCTGYSCTLDVSLLAEGVYLVENLGSGECRRLIVSRQ